MANNFDEAYDEAMQMYVPQEGETNTAEAGGETQSPVPEPAAAHNDEASVPTSPAEEAVGTAEEAVRMAQEQNEQLMQALADIESLKQQNQQLQGTIDELSQKNEENIIEDALTPPVLDINGLAFADEAEQRAVMAKYAEEMSAYNKKQLMEEMSPMLEYAKRGMQEAEKAEVLEALSQIPELSGIRDMVPQLDRLIASNKVLSSNEVPVDERYINAYAMARGINAINNPPKAPEPPKELLELYNKNPEFQQLVEKQRLNAIKNSQQVPLFSASTGAAGATFNIKDKPTTFEEALEASRKQQM